MVVTNSPANTADRTQSVHVFTIRCIQLQFEQRRSRETREDAESFICVCIHMYVVLCPLGGVKSDQEGISGDGGELFEQDVLTQSVQRDVLPHIQTDGAHQLLEESSFFGLF